MSADELNRNAPAAPLVADLPPLTDERIGQLHKENSDHDDGTYYEAFARAIEREVRAKQAERINALERDLAEARAIMQPEGDDPVPQWWYRLHAAAEQLDDSGATANAVDVRYIAGKLLGELAERKQPAGSIGDYTQFHLLLEAVCDASKALEETTTGGEVMFAAADKLSAAVGALIAYIDGRTAGTLPADPMDWLIPCDVTTGAVTIKKGCKLRTLVTRMDSLHRMATAAWPTVTPEQKQANWEALMLAAAPTNQPKGDGK